MSKTTWTVIVSAIFAIAAQVGLPVPLPDEWQIAFRSVAWSGLIFSGLFWLVAHVEILHNKFPANNIVIYILVFCVAGAVAVLFYKLSAKKVVERQTQDEESQKKADERITKLSEEVQKLRDDFLKSPSVSDDAKLSALKNRAAELAHEQDTFSKREKEMLKEEALSLDSMEKARKEYLERVEIEKQQQELAKRQTEIERQNAIKKAAEQNELREKEFAKQYVPIVDYAVTALANGLRDISKQSSETIISDFPGDRPSIYRSTLIKDGKLVDGEHIIRVDSHTEWEFHVKITGAPRPDMPVGRRFLGFQIQAGAASVYITNPRPMMREPYLQVVCRAGDKELYHEDCSFSEYQNL